MAWRFTLDMIPVAKGRPRVTMRGGKPATYTPTKTVSFEQAVAAAARAAMGTAILEGPLRVDILAVLPRPASLMRKRDPEGLVWAPKRPDRDNIEKAVCDGMAACWRDDAQIVCGEPVKCYAEKTGRPRVEVHVRHLRDDETPEAVWTRATRSW